MPTVENKTKKPLKVPLPGGKVLRLGPGKSGEITTKAAEHPALLALVEAGEIEIVGKVRGAGDGGAGHAGKASGPGRRGPGGVRHTGDR